MRANESLGEALYVFTAVLVALFLTGCAGVSSTPVAAPKASPSPAAPAATPTPTSKFVEMLPPTPEPFCTPGASNMKVKASYPKGSGSILVEVSGLHPG